ncbi:sensor histidine kinase [Oceanirhabdus seepicola]|uniref:histidine kinase n=1 Tax=Oceanirhabdus seepicola TaxID=2828781 RepID=A0A9J6NZM2_9CLOT|nr:HAMP domain-containing sensor histidine kinase [Oceanirhabdus seepicola]MCM1989540.1 HAMP domain-containing histidine kinase [Oceanirhabdus seepicola]
MENTSNIDIFIEDPMGKLLYSSKSYAIGEDIDDLMKQIPPFKDGFHPPLDIKKEEIIKGNIKVVWAEDLFIGADFLHVMGTLDNNNSLLLRLPLISIEKSISLANNFSLLVGVILFLVGMFVAYILSKSFTRPILEMNKTTNDLKHLKFDTKCTVESNDELGQLAQSINELSLELDSTISSLNISNKELQQEIKDKIKIDEKRKQLLNNVSHELKTPLALMQGYAEGLKLNVAKNHNRVDFYCDVIMDEAKKMNQLVQNLLNINQIEFGDTSLHKTQFEIVEFVEYILEKYHDKFEANSLNVSFNSISPSMVFVDQLKTEQILTNYINNAIQYVDKNNIINITLENLKDKIRIEVYNSSQKIPEEELEKLWDSFYKMNTARTRDIGGHGLGLSIVKAIQEATGNAYGVRSEDFGVSFWFELDKTPS